jgi:hypothetical protein
MVKPAGGWPLDIDEHAVDVVADNAGQSATGRKRVHERAKPDALHHPFDPNPAPYAIGHRISVHRSRTKSWPAPDCWAASTSRRAGESGQSPDPARKTIRAGSGTFPMVLSGLRTAP